MPPIDQVLAQAEALVGSLQGLKAILEEDTAVAEAEPVPDGPDNSLAFKCPGCGATYEAPVLCTNGHAPEQTVPTADVLAGAAPGGEPAAAAPVEQPNAVVETAVTPPPPPALGPAPAAAEAPNPSWPDAGNAGAPQ